MRRSFEVGERILKKVIHSSFLSQVQTLPMPPKNESSPDLDVDLPEEIFLIEDHGEFLQWLANRVRILKFFEYNEFFII
jgi:hypothetical protein